MSRENLVMGEGVQIADDADIGANVVVHAGTVIGPGCVIQDNAVLGKTPKLARTAKLSMMMTDPAISTGVTRRALCMKAPCSSPDVRGFAAGGQSGSFGGNISITTAGPQRVTILPRCAKPAFSYARIAARWPGSGSIPSAGTPAAKSARASAVR